MKFVNNEKQYIGSTGRNVKKKYYEYKDSFSAITEKVNQKCCTEFVKYLWKLINEGKQHEVSWKILYSTKTSSNSLSLYILCNLERTEIAKFERRKQKK